MISKLIRGPARTVVRLSLIRGFENHDVRVTALGISFLISMITRVVGVEIIAVSELIFSKLLCVVTLCRLSNFLTVENSVRVLRRGVDTCFAFNQS